MKLGKVEVNNMQLEASLDETLAALAEEKKRADQAEAWRDVEKAELYGRKSRSCTSSDPTINLQKQLQVMKDAQDM